MRHLEIKHPEYGKFGKFDAYDTKDLIHGPELPKRLDFHPVSIPNRLPSNTDKNAVSQKVIEILKQIFLDEQPLADLYNWELHVSSYNPHGWGGAKWRYYMVGSLKEMAEAREFTDADAEKKSGIVHSYKSSDPSQTLYQLIRRMRGDPTLKVPVTGNKDIEFNPDVIKKELSEYGEDGYDPNMHFSVKKPIKLWIYTNDAQPTNAYYGNAQILHAPTEEITLKPGMEMLWTHGGSFLIPKSGDKIAYSVALFEPKHPFEKSYGNYKDLWYKQRVEAGELALIGNTVPSGIQFKLHGMNRTVNKNGLKEMVKEAVLSIMNERI